MGQPQGIFFPSILLTFPGILNNCSLPGRGGWGHWVKLDCTQEGCDEQTAVPLQYQYMPLEEKSIVAKSALANFLQQKKKWEYASTPFTKCSGIPKHAYIHRDVLKYKKAWRQRLIIRGWNYIKINVIYFYLEYARVADRWEKKKTLQIMKVG